MFEKNIEKDTSIDNKIANISLTDKESLNSKHTEINKTSVVSNTYDNMAQNEPSDRLPSENDSKQDLNMEGLSLSNKSYPEKVYKSNINKFNFLQTQLSDDNLDVVTSLDKGKLVNDELEKKEIVDHKDEQPDNYDEKVNDSIPKTEKNVTDDSLIAKNHNDKANLNESPIKISEPSQNDEISISVPPRRKKLNSSSEKVTSVTPKKENVKTNIKEYPDYLNPFSDDEEEEEKPKEKKVSTNPFGSSDEEDDDVPPIHPPPRVPTLETTTSTKRLIAVNPFWSDGEEPSSDEETHNGSAKMYNSSMATSTPNLPSSAPRRKKGRAPPPPPIVTVTEAHADHASTSMDDVASISSLSSYNSTIHSDQKSCGKVTPLMKKKRPAPTPPDSLSTASGFDGSLEKGVDSSGIRSNTSDGGRRTKGPAPGLPLPERREVKMQMSPEELQVQLDLLETQQLGLERQGVLIEQMIRDKCEGDDAESVPQEEVEDLVIQLCELVNEKNDLFRKQTELMYIRRQQRLEQEQADIEHEIRIIQSRPAVNRIDADKAREEQLVSRLVEIVRMRDELVQQIDAERRRERQEDLAIATSIATKRAQRNSESNSSSMKSVEVAATPKKSKVKDKVKKQLKKAKHSLISKKKDDSGDRKEDKHEKEKKSK